MHIIIAPNAFKKCLSADKVAECISEGLLKSDLSCNLTLFPIADGGDDTALLLREEDSEMLTTPVHDPIGRVITSKFIWLSSEKKAVIGVSDASGLKLIKNEEQSLLHSSTFGTGELIRAALNKGAEKLIICVGGSATVDGGTGLLMALGLKLFNRNGDELNNVPIDLLQLEYIDVSGLDKRLFSCDIVILCDVKNTLLGEEGAAAVYGPQKGAGEKEVKTLDKCLMQWNKVTCQVTKIDMDLLPFSGAAGGLAAGIAAYTKAKLVSGIEYYLDHMQFNQKLQQADLVITAEGSIDNQTLEGKGPFGVAQRAKYNNIPVIGLAGQVPLQISNEFHNYFDAILPIGHKPSSVNMAMEDTSANLVRTSLELGNLLAIHHDSKYIK